MTDALAGNREPTSESLDVIRNFIEIDSNRASTYFSGDRGVMAGVLKGFARRKDDLKGALCL